MGDLLQVRRTGVRCSVMHAIDLVTIDLGGSMIAQNLTYSNADERNSIPYI